MTECVNNKNQCMCPLVFSKRMHNSAEGVHCDWENEITFICKANEAMGGGHLQTCTPSPIIKT